MAELPAAGLPYPEGDPGALHRAAAGLGRMAAEADRLGDEVGRSGQVPGWLGDAAAVHVDSTMATSQEIGGGADALGDAGLVVGRLADRLDEAQTRIEGWGREIEAAEDRVAAAQADTLPLFGGLANPFERGPGTTDPERLRQRAADLGNEAAELRARYEAEARALVSAIEEADRSTARSVDEAASRHPGSGPRLGNYRDTPDVYRLAPVLHLDPDEKYPRADLIEAIRLGRDGEPPEWSEDQRTEVGTAPALIDFDRETGQLTYFNYWRYNNFQNNPEPFSDHYQDTETVSFLTGEDTGIPTRAALSAHNRHHVLDASELRGDDGRYHVVVSRGGHGQQAQYGDIDGPSPWEDDTEPGGAADDTRRDLAPVSDREGVVGADGEPVDYLSDPDGKRPDLNPTGTDFGEDIRRTPDDFGP